MIGAPSSTYFTAAPHWEWLIVFYFFFGGLAGGCYFLAALIDLFGRPEDRPLARLGYSIAFPCVVLCGLILIVDLGRPLRFWHMLVQRNTFEPMVKLWSPMSAGSWALAIFGVFSFVSFVSGLAESDRGPWRRLRGIGGGPIARRIVAVPGGIAGFYVAGYTGVLLAVTNRPIWSDTPLLGMLFVVSAASTSAALLILVAGRQAWSTPGIAALHRMDDWVLLLELVVIIAVVVSLGPVAAAWLNVWGALLLLVVIGGLLVPLWMSWRARHTRHLNATAAAALVLAGGFLLRVVIVLSSEAI